MNDYSSILEALMILFGFPIVWILEDLVVLVATLFVLRHAASREERPAQAILEFVAFTCCYAAVYENGASLAGLYGYGRSLLMIGIVPFSVPALEYLVLYAALLMLEKMRLPTWCKPFVVGFWGLLQDFSLDPLAVRQVFVSEGRPIGRWSWLSLAPGDANIANVPVYNFPGWILILGLGSAALLAGRWWWARSGYKAWVGVAYPFLAALVGLVVLVLPSSQLLLWLAPFFAKGSSGEWIMLGSWFVLALSLLAFAWRGRMKGRLSWAADWPVFVVPALFHASDLCFSLVGGFTEILWIELAFGIFHCGLVALVWARGRKVNGW
jgi:hypothetical protein